VKYRPGVQGTKSDSFIKKLEDLPSDQDNERRQYQYQIILKNRNLELKMRSTISLAVIFTDELEADMT